MAGPKQHGHLGSLRLFHQSTIIGAGRDLKTLAKCIKMPLHWKWRVMTGEMPRFLSVSHESKRRRTRRSAMEQGMVQDVKDEQLEDWQSGTYFFRPAADFDDE